MRSGANGKIGPVSGMTSCPARLRLADVMVRGQNASVALTIAGKKGSLKSMIRVSKTLLAGVLVLAFALGLACVALAAPGSSVNHCSQINQPRDLSECDHPAYVCPFAAASLLSQGLPNQPRSMIHPNGTGDLKRFGVAFTALVDSPVGLARGRQDAHRIGRRSGVSVGLLDSVLNL